jgi:hypothetical protein
MLGGRERMQFLRGSGGLLLAVGAVIALTRKSGSSGSTELARALIVGVPCVALYMLSVGAPERPAVDARESWRSPLLVASVLLAPLSMLLLLHWLGADTNNGLWDAAVFAITALLAAYGSQRARVPYAALIAALGALVVWLALWAEVLGSPSLNTVRGLLVAAAALLLMLAAAVARSGRVGAGEIATAGGVAAVLAGALGVFAGSATALSDRLLVTGSEGSVRAGRGTDAVIARTGELQSFGWDLYLLLVSLVLVWLGARARVRGLGYVGAAGLLIFIVSVGLQVTRLESGRAPIHSLGGWPIVLVVIGAVGLAAPALFRHDRPDVG